MGVRQASVENCRCVRALRRRNRAQTSGCDASLSVLISTHERPLPPSPYTRAHFCSLEYSTSGTHQPLFQRTHSDHQRVSARSPAHSNRYHGSVQVGYVISVPAHGARSTGGTHRSSRNVNNTMLTCGNADDEEEESTPPSSPPVIARRSKFDDEEEDDDVRQPQNPLASMRAP